MQKQLFPFSMLYDAGEKTKGFEGRGKLKGAERFSLRLKVNELLIN